MRTLADWRSGLGSPTRTLGAPAGTSTPTQRRAVADFLLLHGVAVGVPTLVDHFPGIARGELARLLWCARLRADEDRRAVDCRALTWTCPGSVWAMDYTDPPRPIDGTYAHVLVVRDLASGCLLDALPVTNADAAATAGALARLFVQHGQPLVIKSDNGSHFTGSAVRQLLDRWNVPLLLSPPRTPQYNGSCEAGIGSLKTRVHHLAARDGDTANWTCDHVEAGRLLGNRTRRFDGTIPEERFAQRAPLAQWQRQRVLDAIDRAEREAVEFFTTPDSVPNPGAIRRRAIADALLGTGFLEIRRRPVRQPIRKLFLA